MNNFTFKAAVGAVALLTSLSASAQSYIKEAPTSGFDFAKGKDYVVIYAPSKALEGMGKKIISDQNLDPEQKKNQFFYWTTDWDKTGLQLTAVEEAAPSTNSYGTTGEYLNMTPLFDWGGGGFGAKSTPYDLSKVSDDMILHIGLKDFGNDAKQAKFKFQVGPLAKINSNGFQLEVNLSEGASDGNYVGVGSVGHDKKWYYIDIPVKDLIDENGSFGFAYDFSAPINDHVFTVTFKEAKESKATSVLEPGNTVKTYTVTDLQTALALDGIWFYKNETDGIKNLTAIGDEGIERIYDINGRQVSSENLQRGIYLVKTGKSVRKIAIR